MNNSWPAGPLTRFSRLYELRGSCWVWVGCASGSNGYGGFRLQGKRWRAHRASWVLHRGPIPAGMLVLHSCDNRRCVNPEHLFLGTHEDNQQDAMRKGRWVPQKQTLNGRAKLTLQTAQALRDAYRNGGITAEAAGHRYGVSKRTALDVIHGKSWG